MPSFAFFKKKRKQDIPDRSPFSAGSPQPQPSKPAQRPSAAASPVNLSGPAAAALAHPTVSAHPSPVSSSSAASSSVAPPSPAMISVLDHLDGNAAPSSRAAASATPPPQAAPSSAPPQQHKTAAAVAQPPSNAPTIQSLLNASPDAAPAAAPPAATVAASPSPGNNPASLAAAPSSHPHGSAASTIATSSSSMAGLLQQQPGLQPAPAQPQLLQYLPQQQAAQQAALRETKGKYALTDFALQRTLGTGSFGRVHLVQSRHNSRFYAVKVLKKAQVVKMKQVEHTNDERRMLQRVKHPFLITLWGTFQDAKNLYMVMDFVEGGELFSLLRKSQVGAPPLYA
jgi:protein kinase A